MGNMCLVSQGLFLGSEKVGRVEQGVDMVRMQF